MLYTISVAMISDSLLSAKIPQFTAATSMDLTDAVARSMDTIVNYDITWPSLEKMTLENSDRRLPFHAEKSYRRLPLKVEDSNQRLPLSQCQLYSPGDYRWISPIRKCNITTMKYILPGGCLNIKISSYQLRDPHVKDKTVSRPSYL